MGRKNRRIEANVSKLSIKQVEAITDDELRNALANPPSMADRVTSVNAFLDEVEAASLRGNHGRVKRLCAAFRLLNT